MEIRDGFILGVYNYCDRWCERCSLASRCRVCADGLSMSLDLPEESPPGAGEPPSVVRSLGAVAAAFAQSIPDEFFACGSKAGEGLEVNDRPRRAELEPAERELERRVQDLSTRFWNWLAPESRAGEPAVRDAVEVLHHFAIYIGPKVHRALIGRKDCEEDGMLSDALGSAKVALLALDRLGDAWLGLAERGVISVLEAAPVLAELQSIAGEVERRFPRAHDFVRPGFDEPEALAMLEWRERG